MSAGSSLVGLGTHKMVIQKKQLTQKEQQQKSLVSSSGQTSWWGTVGISSWSSRSVVDIRAVRCPSYSLPTSAGAAATAAVNASPAFAPPLRIEVASTHHPLYFARTHTVAAAASCKATASPLITPLLTVYTSPHTCHKHSCRSATLFPFKSSPHRSYLSHTSNTHSGRSGSSRTRYEALLKSPSRCSHLPPPSPPPIAQLPQRKQQR